MGLIHYCKIVSHGLNKNCFARIANNILCFREIERAPSKMIERPDIFFHVVFKCLVTFFTKYFTKMWKYSIFKKLMNA